MTTVSAAASPADQVDAVATTFFPAVLAVAVAVAVALSAFSQV
jgi:hypothetical protein